MKVRTLKPVVGDRVGSATYPIFAKNKKGEFPIGFAVKVKGGWVGIRNTHAFERPTRYAVIESLMLAERKSGS